MFSSLPKYLLVDGNWNRIDLSYWSLAPAAFTVGQMVKKIQTRWWCRPPFPSPNASTDIQPSLSPHVRINTYRELKRLKANLNGLYSVSSDHVRPVPSMLFRLGCESYEGGSSGCAVLLPHVCEGILELSKCLRYLSGCQTYAASL